jgi:NAD(P)-dependent dehydrogenase (short-subunit alcohol dehydrogenase family)
MTAFLRRTPPGGAVTSAGCPAQSPAGTRRFIHQRWNLESMPSQSGRLVLVTGANSGIGYVVAREFARRDAHVVMACRNAERGAAALKRLRDEVPGAQAELRRVDLAHLGAIRDFGRRWDHGRLDLLVNNAGIAMAPFQLTADGFESHFGINHLGTFALTALLLPHLLASASPRVVTVSSEGQRVARLDFDSLNSGRHYRPMARYLQSKRANLHFAMELHRRAVAAGLGLRSMAAAPGLSRTSILAGGAEAGARRVPRAMLRQAVRYLGRPVVAGAWTCLYAATADDLPGGSYIVPAGPLQLRGRPKPRPEDKTIGETAAAGRLWHLSEQLTGVSFSLHQPA